MKASPRDDAERSMRVRLRAHLFERLYEMADDQRYRTAEDLASAILERAARRWKPSVEPERAA